MAAAGGGAAAGRAYSFKVVLLGEGCVGKTSLVLRYCENKFNDKHITTLQVQTPGEPGWGPAPAALLCLWPVTPPSHCLSRWPWGHAGSGQRVDVKTDRGKEQGGEGPGKVPQFPAEALQVGESPSVGSFSPPRRFRWGTRCFHSPVLSVSPFSSPEK